MAGDRVVALGFRLRVAEAFREQLAGALNGVLLFSDMVTTVVKQARQRLAGGLPVHTVLHAAGQPGDQRGALHQPLGIDDRVIFFRAHGLAERFALGFDRRGKPRLTPAANRHRDDPVDALMPGRDLHEAFFNHPVETNAGKGQRSVAQRGQRVQHVAHGRGFYDQYPHPLVFLLFRFFQQQVV